MGGCSRSRLGVIVASSDPRRLKMIRRGGREEAVGGCSPSRLGVIAASSGHRRFKVIRRGLVGACKRHGVGGFYCAVFASRFNVAWASPYGRVGPAGSLAERPFAKRSFAELSLWVTALPGPIG